MHAETLTAADAIESAVRARGAGLVAIAGVPGSWITATASSPMCSRALIFSIRTATRGKMRRATRFPRYTISIVGSAGFMGLVGYDWEPLGVDFATKASPKLERHVTDAKGFIW